VHRRHLEQQSYMEKTRPQYLQRLLVPAEIHYPGLNPTTSLASAIYIFMVYATTGIPVGAYQLTRLSALGWIGRAMARAETAPDRRRDLAQDQARVAGKGRNARKAPSASFAAGRKARKARRAGRSNP